MAIYINGTAILADGVVEPVSLTDAKNWMRIDYTSDDTLIQSLINASRIHIEKLTGVAFVNKLLKSYIQTTGYEPSVWMVDLPYGPVICIDSVKIKTGINTWETLTKNEDYEVIAGKLWLYTQGNYEVQYQSGFSSVPEDIATDILTLTTWQYENRGKKFEGDARSGLLQAYPNWDGLNYHQYKKIVI